MIRRSIGTPTARTQLRLNIRFNASSFCPGLFAHAEPSGRKLVAPRSKMPSVESRGPGYVGPIFKGSVFTLASYTDAMKVLYSSLSCEHPANVCRYAASVLRWSYFGRNIAGRATSILCLYYLRVIKRALSFSTQVSLCLYFAHNCATVAEVNFVTGFPFFFLASHAVELSA